MNIIFFSRREGRARHVNLGHPLAVAGFAMVLVAILATAFSLGLKIGESRTAPRGVATWSQTLAEQQAEIKELKAELQRRVATMATPPGYAPSGPQYVNGPQPQPMIVQGPTMSAPMTMSAGPIADPAFNADPAHTSGINTLPEVEAH